MRERERKGKRGVEREGGFAFALELSKDARRGSLFPLCLRRRIWPSSRNLSPRYSARIRLRAAPPSRKGQLQWPQRGTRAKSGSKSRLLRCRRGGVRGLGTSSSLSLSTFSVTVSTTESRNRKTAPFPLSNPCTPPSRSPIKCPRSGQRHLSAVLEAGGGGESERVRGAGSAKVLFGRASSLQLESSPQELGKNRNCFPR